MHAYCVTSDGVCVGGVCAYSKSLVAGQLELINAGSGCYEGSPHQLSQVHHQRVTCTNTGPLYY